MESVDSALLNLNSLKATYNEYIKNGRYLNEADTRAKLIDIILKEVLLWPEVEMSREVRSDDGYLDYLLQVNGKKLVCVEAKKEGQSFSLPKDRNRKYYKINGAFSTDSAIKEAVFQARGYCDDMVIRYAIVTNGNTWIVFRAIREDMPWKEGNARVFASIDNIIESFTEFWNLLAYENINKGSLDTEFSSSTTSNRQLLRVLNYIHEPDVPLLRNSLHTELHPIIYRFFEDITDPNYIETLENCYVYMTSILTAAQDMDFVIKDSIPKFLKDEGAVDIIQTKDKTGVFGRVIENSFSQQNGQLFLLLGGIGSGKSTFQKRYQLTVGKGVLNNHSIWFSLNFLKPPEIGSLETFVWSTLLDQLRTKYNTPHLETRKNIKRIFKQEIEALEETALFGLVPGSREYETALNPHLSKWQGDLSEYVPRLLSIAKPKRELTVVIFFDNVDQLSPTYQAQIFLLAQRITDKVKSTTIIALREESYYAASVQKVFTAYINRKFHIASPPFRQMIGKRIKYVLKVMQETDTSPLRKFKEFSELRHKNKISDFLKIVEFSIFERNRNIGRFIDHLCFGNMRQALQMFSTFLVSGATDVDKMLRIFWRDGNYFVPFHEFLRSIMLGERYYYKEVYSVILNLFECGQERNSSHFTSLRILYMLNLHKSESTKEGEGFCEISNILGDFEDAFNNKEDFLKSLNRLVNRQLVETNTKNFDNITGSSHIRITSAGWYYLKYLSSSFAYLDLVFQDTPIDEEATVLALSESMRQVNNLSDPEESKVVRMEERFRRVGIFLNYLHMEENKEESRYAFKGSTKPIHKLFTAHITEQWRRQKDWITNRLQQNRERYRDDDIMSINEDFVHSAEEEVVDVKGSGNIPNE